MRHQIQKPMAILSHKYIQEVVHCRLLGRGELAHLHLIIEMLFDPADSTGCQPTSQIVDGTGNYSEAILLENFERILKVPPEHLFPVIRFQMLDQGHRNFPHWQPPKASG